MCMHRVYALLEDTRPYTCTYVVWLAPPLFRRVGLATLVPSALLSYPRLCTWYVRSMSMCLSSMSMCASGMCMCC